MNSAAQHGRSRSILLVGRGRIHAHQGKSKGLRHRCHPALSVYLARGDSLNVATKRHVAKATLLVLIGSPQLTSLHTPVDWVEEDDFEPH
jgi:hypothetical protein